MITATPTTERWTVETGDALVLLRDLYPESIDLVLTDPPYSSGGCFRGDRTQSTRIKYQSTGVQTEHRVFSGDSRDQRGFELWVALWVAECVRITRPGSIIALFTDWRQIAATVDAIQAGGVTYRGIVPWDKINGRPIPNRPRNQCEFVVWGTNGPRSSDKAGATYHPGIVQANPVPTARRMHSTEKPVEILAELCQLAPPDGVVLDPFMGSGSTGVAALATGRRFLGFELDPETCREARHRIAAAEKELEPCK